MTLKIGEYVYILPNHRVFARVVGRVIVDGVVVRYCLQFCGRIVLWKEAHEVRSLRL